MKHFFNRQFMFTVFLTVFLSASAFLLLKTELIGFSYTLFIIIPILIGYCVGQRPDWKINLIFAAIFGLVFFFILLVASSSEFFFVSFWLRHL